MNYFLAFFSFFLTSLIVCHTIDYVGDSYDARKEETEEVQEMEYVVYNKKTDTYKRFTSIQDLNEYIANQPNNLFHIYVSKESIKT